MTYFTDSSFERMMVQVPEAPRREFEAPAVLMGAEEQPVESEKESEGKHAVSDR